MAWTVRTSRVVGVRMSSDNDPSPHIITVNIAHRVMMKVTQTVYRDKYGHRYELLHEVSNPAGKARTGFYRLVMYYKHDKDVAQVSHLFDIAPLLDMREGWEAYVEKKTLAMMRDVFGGGIDD